MNYQTMDARAYRALSSEDYQERRSLVVGLAGDMPEDATEEQIRSIDTELDIIKAEDSRRDSLIELRNHKAAKVIAGAGSVIDEVEPEQHEPEQRNASLGARVVAEMKQRGFTQGERFNITNVAFRDSSHTQTVADLNPSDGSAGVDPVNGTYMYGIDALTDTDTTIREGYRRPLTIVDLFGSEVTDKDAISYYHEGDAEGHPAMTTEGSGYQQIHVANPVKATASLLKVTAMWKATDELLTDAPRLVSHINSRAAYLMDIEKENVLIGKGPDQDSGATPIDTRGLLDANGIATEAISNVSLELVDALLDYRTTITNYTPNFEADALVVSNDDYATLMKLRNGDNQYLLGGPTNMVYGNSAAITPVLWNTIRVVPTAALEKGTMILGAFKRGATVVNHSSGRRFEMNYDGNDFSRGLVTFRTSERFVLAVEYPRAFVKITIQH